MRANQRSHPTGVPGHWTIAISACLVLGIGAVSATYGEATNQQQLMIIAEEEEGGGGGGGGPGPAPICVRNISADVVALDQPIFWNRLGAVLPDGMMFALKSDVVSTIATTGGALTAGSVKLRDGKRPRPLVLRMNVGDCLTVNFTNLLDPSPRGDQPATREASVHAIGMQLVDSIADDGSWVGLNGSSVVLPGGSAKYTFYAEREGQHVLNSGGATTTGEGNGGQINFGLFGAINVEPKGSNWLRSQVTAEDLRIAAGDLLTTLTVDESLRTTQKHPIVNYDAVYPDGHARAGVPIFNMLSGLKIVHSDLTAIIEGPFAEVYPRNDGVYPNRDESFREFTIIYHDEIKTFQAFPEFFDDPVLAHTLHSVRDGFAINYGSGGIGSEIIANRLAVGPMRDCVGCKYEEFFLASSCVGDPAMIVDWPANACVGDPACRATEAFYPDDPSNVYHSYLQDHVKFRILHGGSKEHHIHHLHAHQWLYAPDSDNSAYLDSQAIGPGSAFTLEIAYNGSGNRNQTVGDSIFHCHFYPHFAQGMWALWRVHDVFEDGTRMLPDGEIKKGTPIPGVVAIPGRVMAPMPEVLVTIEPDPLLPAKGGQVKIGGKFYRNMTLADVTGNPGYPFFIPIVAGDRPPHPPLDTLWDGGLQRHVIESGTANEVHTRLDFTKEYIKLNVWRMLEDGEPVEERAMTFHERRWQTSFKTDGSAGSFRTNGAKRQRGAPYADPCIDDFGNPIGLDADGEPKRKYKAANIQIDAVLNKTGWHYPQTRLITLWDDVQPTFDGVRAPEPFFFRANSEDCISFEHTNLVPNNYELDDFQVRTPTDILGQHIHLVKFDVTSSDGSANGWNYEDGNFSPQETRERIDAIRLNNGCPVPIEPDPLEITSEPLQIPFPDPTIWCPVALDHPVFGAGPENEWKGATISVQRWMADPVVNNGGDDRTLRTIFTHDHFGPSTHQQAGLYASLVIEPKDSTWRDPESGFEMGGRGDGGPTSWRADIWTANASESYREFMFQYADFQLAYEVNSHPNLKVGSGPNFALDYDDANFTNTPPGRQPGEGYDRPKFVINPPAKEDAPLPVLVKKLDFCPVLEDENGVPGPLVPLPCPEAISAADVGTMTLNYRNDPIALRVLDTGNGLGAPKQALGLPGDLSHVFRSDVTRAQAELNTPRSAWPYEGYPQTQTVGSLQGDPFTPIMRAYEDDRIQVRLQVGATEEGHNLTIYNMKWLFEPSWMDSGWRNSQMMGISEHFELITDALPDVQGNRPFVDRLYQFGAATDDLWSGTWGLIRTYNADLGILTDLQVLPSNPDGKRPIPINNINMIAIDDFDGMCPLAAPQRNFDLAVVLASTSLPNGRVEFNTRGVNGGPLVDPTAIVYVRKSDLVPATNKLLPGLKVEPLILRANAGDCINVTLENLLPLGTVVAPDLDGWSSFPFVVENFNANDVSPSASFGLHPQLVAFDVLTSDGANVGFNVDDGTVAGDPQTVAPGESITYQWYAGCVVTCEANGPVPECDGQPNGLCMPIPIEFGATSLMSSDRMKHSNKGAIGALIIEPQGATWTTVAATVGPTGIAIPATRAQATVDPDGDSTTNNSFQEFVLLFQDDVNMRFGSDTFLPVDIVEGLPGGPSVIQLQQFLAGEPVPNTGDGDDAEDSGQKAFNYNSEPFWFRGGWAPNASMEYTRTQQIADIMSNAKVGGDPQTPVFTASAGSPARFRVVHPGGKARNHVFDLHGHVWQKEPYINASRDIGDNKLSLWEGARMGIGPTDHFDAPLINGAGGKFKITGDFLYRDFNSFMLDGGMWGILRVGG